MEDGANCSVFFLSGQTRYTGVMQQKGDRRAFDEAYASLNREQKKAVDSIEGPVMVIAGPGTGKTQILTLRIAKILLETQVGPENILALTFTEAGAKAMRDRLHFYIGSAAYAVGFYTFHGFAQHLIGQYPEAYSRVIGGRPASDLERIEIIELILEDPSIKILRPVGNPVYYAQPLIRIISAMKGEYITPDRLSEIIDAQERQLLATEKIHEKGVHKGKVRGEYLKLEKDIAKNRELLHIYRAYEALLADRRLYDFDDMIAETVRALESNEDMLRDLQEQYQYVLADEHQDVNGAQNRMLELLAHFHDAPNIFVVGDEKQAIYRFQGASLENFLHFSELFPDTLMIELTSNYRSGQTILDASHGLIAVEEGPLKDLRKALSAEKNNEASVSIRDFKHQGIEDSWLVAQVQKLIETGIEHEEIAIIVRTNKEVEALAAALRAAGIAVNASADSDVLEHPITHAIEDILRAIAQPQDEEALFRLLHGSYWGIPAGDLVRLMRKRSRTEPLAKLIADTDELTGAGIEYPEALLKVHTLLTRSRAASLTDAPHAIIASFLNDSGFLDAALAHDPTETTRVIRRIYDEIEQMVIRDHKTTLLEVAEVFSLHRFHRIALTAPYLEAPERSVQVMTAHKSKGLEFEAVFVPHLVDGSWGGNTKPTYFSIPFERFAASKDAALDDELRLLFVAATRAKRILNFSYAETNAEGRVLSMSRLLDRLDSAYMQSGDGNMEEAAFDPLTAIREQQRPILIDRALLTAHLETQGLSATSLNNYLESPWNYLYRNVLRIPEVQDPSLLYGTALHAVMEWVNMLFRSSKRMPTTTELSAQLRAELSKLPISDALYAQLHEKGLLSLTLYLEHADLRFAPQSKVEFALKAQLPTGLPQVPNVLLTGKLDRIDLDVEGNVLQVIDYKTGKPKSRNEIEGKTKNGSGNYKRQLVFYALLLSLYEDGKYACRTGTLSFLEPDAKGAIHEETFVITDEEIVELKAEIIAVAAKITSGAFLTEPCDPQKCEYCDLVALLSLH